MKKFVSIVVFALMLASFAACNSGSEEIAPDIGKSCGGLGQALCTSCSEGQVLADGACVASCPTGQEAVDGVCTVSCPDGQEAVDGVCTPVATTCPEGQVMTDGVCKAPSTACPEGEEKVSGVCTAVCPEGQKKVNGVCVVTETTVPQFVIVKVENVEKSSPPAQRGMADKSLANVQRYQSPETLAIPSDQPYVVTFIVTDKAKGGKKVQNSKFQWVLPEELLVQGLEIKSSRKDSEGHYLGSSLTMKWTPDKEAIEKVFKDSLTWPQEGYPLPIKVTDPASGATAEATFKLKFLFEMRAAQVAGLQAMKSTMKIIAKGNNEVKDGGWFDVRPVVDRTPGNEDGILKLTATVTGGSGNYLWVVTRTWKDQMTKDEWPLKMAHAADSSSFDPGSAASPTDWQMGLPNCYGHATCTVTFSEIVPKIANEDADPEQQIRFEVTDKNFQTVQSSFTLKYVYPPDDLTGQDGNGKQTQLCTSYPFYMDDTENSTLYFHVYKDGTPDNAHLVADWWHTFNNDDDYDELPFWGVPAYRGVAPWTIDQASFNNTSFESCQHPSNNDDGHLYGCQGTSIMIHGDKVSDILFAGGLKKDSGDAALMIDFVVLATKHWYAVYNDLLPEGNQDDNCDGHCGHRYFWHSAYGGDGDSDLFAAQEHVFNDDIPKHGINKSIWHRRPVSNTNICYLGMGQTGDEAQNTKEQEHKGAVDTAVDCVTHPLDCAGSILGSIF